ncbi:multiple sugar transport system ATP-binding protein [Mesorhizobium soli]|uniref:ABC transporter ATP-binding protein n=1 Tax=Pseudaminobacter soli (ex Li et al. 2025) TaxID=1295366 RepID=UPI0024771A3D|nr:ABC transporter ATP-binding protein [Mesorhizobium soli]MDH6231590.1 multiple sugar transport system ATP-binding protein [Mesorhizobium soli]
MTATVSISSIEKNFGATKTLKGVSVDVEAGEFLTLVGPSGCGKSTLLRIIAGLIPQDGGTISIDGAPVDHLLPKARDVSMVFQSYALYPHMSVRDNIATPLKVRRLNSFARWPLVGKFAPGQAAARAEIAEAVKQVAAQVEIEPLLDRRPAQLSGGQRQRVALARAMVRQPRVFLMDEPLSNLDARLRVHMRGELSELHQRLGATFIYVTHDQVEAMTMSTRVALMMDGEIIQVATPNEIYANPADVRVARFIGSPEINLLTARADPQGRISIAGRATALRTEATGQLTVGLRPEILTIDDGSSDIVIDGRLQRVERLGHDVLLHVRDDGSDKKNMTLRISAAELEALQMSGRLEENFNIGARASAALLFDADGKRLPAIHGATAPEPITYTPGRKLVGA